MTDFGMDKKIELRMLVERDAEELYRLLRDNEEYLKKWMPGFAKPIKLSDAETYVKFGTQQHMVYKEAHIGIFVDSKLVGVVSYRKPDWENRIISLGYWIIPSYQGGGLVTKTCRALTDLAFTSFGMNRVEIACGTENVKSQAVAKRLGFTREGVVRQAEYVNDHYVDHVIYGMLAADWVARGDEQLRGIPRNEN